MDGLTIIALIIGSLVALFPLVYISYVNIGGFYHTLRRALRQTSICSVDTDCPPGHTCVNGSCISQAS